MGQTLNKAYGIRQDALAFIRQAQLPGGRIQRGEQLILGVDFGPGQHIQ